MLENPKVQFRRDPSATYSTAEFFHSTGRIKDKPTSWKYYFFASAHNLRGG
jgi:NitT/TauT family transport system substrate-binding protein